MPHWCITQRLGSLKGNHFGDDSPHMPSRVLAHTQAVATVRLSLLYSSLARENTRLGSQWTPLAILQLSIAWVSIHNFDDYVNLISSVVATHGTNMIWISCLTIGWLFHWFCCCECLEECKKVRSTVSLFDTNRSALLCNFNDVLILCAHCE